MSLSSGIRSETGDGSGEVEKGKEKVSISKGELGEAPVTNWRKLFQAASDQTLSFFPPKTSNGKLIISPPVEVIEEGELLWRNAVVVQFVGRIPNFSAFQRQVNIL